MGFNKTQPFFPCPSHLKGGGGGKVWVVWLRWSCGGERRRPPQFARVGAGAVVGRHGPPWSVLVCRLFPCRSSVSPSFVYEYKGRPMLFIMADWAMAGGRLAGVDDSLFFFNPYSAVCPEYFPTRVARFHIRVGDHCFYSPTAYYAET